MTDDRASVFEIIASRKSVRTFDEAPIARDQLEKCLEAARLAPSWANKQCWHFVVVEGRQEVDDLGLVPAHIKGATALVVACADPEKSGNIDGKPYYMVDTAIAVEHLVLTAWDLGIGTVWVGAFKEDRVRKALGIPGSIRVVALVPMGYPAEKEGLGAKLVKRIAGSANRKGTKDIVHWGKW